MLAPNTKQLKSTLMASYTKEILISKYKNVTASLCHKSINILKKLKNLSLYLDSDFESHLDEGF